MIIIKTILLTIIIIISIYNILLIFKFVHGAIRYDNSNITEWFMIIILFISLLYNIFLIYNLF